MLNFSTNQLVAKTTTMILCFEQFHSFFPDKLSVKSSTQFQAVHLSNETLLILQ